MKPIDETGNKYGRLIVIKQAETQHHPNGRTTSMWLCQCDCGKTKVVSGESLRRGNTISCGCYQKERQLESHYKHGDTVNKRSRLHSIWSNMRQRCFNLDYEHYGKRGITICNEWNQYASFKEWALTHGYTDKLTIDRIDVNGNYEPNNCRWVDMVVQQNNRSNNVILTIKGEKHTVTEWSRIKKINVGTIRKRLKNGWSEEDAVLTPPRKCNKS